MEQNQADKNRLDVQTTVADLNNLYNNVEEIGYNVMAYGDAGTGKTTAALTLPKPIYIQSFDNHGWASIRQHIDGRNVLVDTRFEPAFGAKSLKKGETVYGKWEKEFKRLESIGFFDSVGSFVIDSATSWANAIMDEVMARANSAITDGWMMDRKNTPKIKEWYIQTSCIQYALDSFLALPCNCYLACHTYIEKETLPDDTERIVRVLPLLTGQLKEKVPPMFDEVYKTVLQTGASDNTFNVITRHNSPVVAKSRLAGTPPKLNRVEPFNFRKIMEKVGMNASDKPPFKTGAAENEISGR